MVDGHRTWKRQGEAFWRAHHEAWKRSDLNQRQYCEANGLPQKAFDRLGDTLGKHHDLEVFQQLLLEEDFGDPQIIEVLTALARRRQKTLEEEAFSIGARLLAESAASLTSRWGSYWDAWRENDPRAAALAA